MRIPRIIGVFVLILSFFLTACGGGGLSGSGGSNGDWRNLSPVNTGNRRDGITVDKAISDGVTAYEADQNTLTFAMGTDMSAVAQLLKQKCNELGLTCKTDFMGSIDQSRLLNSDGAKPKYDAYFMGSDVIARLANASTKLKSMKSVYTTPLVFAVSKGKANELGYVGKDVTMQQIIADIKAGKVKPWLTTPGQNTTGSTVLLQAMGLAAGNGPGTALTMNQVNSPAVKQAATEFTRAFSRTYASSNAMTTECSSLPDQCQGLFGFENAMLEMNRKMVEKGYEPFQLVYPKGSLAVGNAPLGFLNHGNDEQKFANFQKLQDWLLSADGQDALLKIGRRPANSFGLILPNAPQDVFNPAWGVHTNRRDQAMVYPTSDVINAALTQYQSAFRKPTATAYCLDGSGSMGENNGWVGVQATSNILFVPGTAAEYNLQATTSDYTSAIIFDNHPKDGWPVTVKGNDANGFRDMNTRIQSTSPGGGTGVYNCLNAAADGLTKVDGNVSKRIILMTDGDDNAGGSDAVMPKVNQMGIPVITIGFGGDVRPEPLKTIAQVTGGVYIDGGKNPGDLAVALRTATGTN